MIEYVPQWITPLFPNESRKIANRLSLKAACKHAMRDCGPDVDSRYRAREAWMLLPNVLEFIDRIPHISSAADAESEYRLHLECGVTFESIARYTREFAEVHIEWDNENRGWYAEYLLSDHWQAIRQEVHQYYDGQCRTCCSTENLEVHHRHYHTIGREDVKRDLILLCAFCHNAIHQAQEIRPPKKKPAWLS